MADVAASAGHPIVAGLPTKYVSLVVLVVQNSALVLTMRYSRILPGPQYLSSTAVVMSEMIKCTICLIVHLYQQATASPAQSIMVDETNTVSPSVSLRRLLDDMFSVRSGFFKLLIPAVLYTLQNNLQYIAATNLDAATFQVTYQCKILTTALFAVILLRQSLSGLKWLSLLILTIGVACVQIPSTSTTPTVAGNWTLGIMAVAIACLCSGFAGVYFEKVLKSASSSASASLWVRNVQLSVGCLAIALTGTLLCDGAAIRARGFFQGYRPITVVTICIQAAGGLIVALVIKYADNILKGFATSLSIILSTIVSIYLFDFVVTRYFILGSLLVCGATYMYSMPNESTPRQDMVRNKSAVESMPMMQASTDDAEKGMLAYEDSTANTSRTGSLDDTDEGRQQRYERQNGRKIYDELGYVD